MHLCNIKLTNFRNYQGFSVNFAPLTIFIGNNGVGKTNLLEALDLIATTTSYRTRENKNLIKWGEDFAKIQVEFSRQNKSSSLELRIVGGNRSCKQAYIDGAKKELKYLLGNLSTVLFSPEVVQALASSPSAKRRLINILASQVNGSYIDDLLQLSRIVTQKNKLLFSVKMGKNQPKELDFWDNQLLKVNREIVAKRTEIINFFNQKVNNYYQKISQSKDQLKIVYHAKIPQKQSLALFINHSREKEINSAICLFGPHRDEINILINNRPTSGLVSRGELRSIVLAWKFAEIDYLTQATGSRPILLLDDIFSELDANHRRELIGLIGQQQTIITATDLAYLQKQLSSAKIIELPLAEGGPRKKHVAKT